MSKRWAALNREVESLRGSLLPRPFNPIGVYARPKQIQARTRAFVVLSHAEIESFLEEWAKDIARAAEVVWTKHQRVARPLAHLVASLAERVRDSESLSVPNAKDSHQRFADVVKDLFPEYYKRIKENNGVKERNVLRLFDPIGVAGSAFGTTLLPNLTSFGSARGQHAHYSRRSVTTVLDPLDEYNRVTNILNDLKGLETWLVGYRRLVR